MPKHFCFVCSVIKSYPILCNPMDCSLPGSLSMGFSRQEYWSGLTFSSPGDLLGLGFETMSFTLAGGFFTTDPPRKPLTKHIVIKMIVVFVLSYILPIKL